MTAVFPATYHSTINSPYNRPPKDPCDDTEEDVAPVSTLSFFLSGLPKWAKHAVCDPNSSNLFHDYDDMARKFLYEAQAKALCAVCPVKKACLEMALETKDIFSISGGLTPMERAKKYPKVFDARINTNSRDNSPSATYLQRNGRHIAKRVYFRKTHQEKQTTPAIITSKQLSLDFGIEIITWEEKKGQLAFLPPLSDKDAYKAYLISGDTTNASNSNTVKNNDSDDDDDCRVGLDYSGHFRQTIRFPRRKAIKNT